MSSVMALTLTTWFVQYLIAILEAILLAMAIAALIIEAAQEELSYAEME
jgi:hypothetical protein